MALTDINGSPLKFEARIDTSKLESDAKSVKDILSGLKIDTKPAAKSLSDITNESSKTIVVSKELNKTFGELSGNMQGVHTSIAKAKNETQSLAQTERDLRKALKDNLITEDEYIKKLAIISARRTELNDKLREYRTQLKAVEVEKSKAKPYTSADTALELNQASGAGLKTSGTVVNSAEIERSAQANAAYAVSSQNVTNTLKGQASASGSVSQANIAQMATLESLKLELADYRAKAALATDPAKLKLYNAEIQTLKGEVKRMSNVGKAGFDSMGNAIVTNTTKVGGFTKALNASWGMLRKLAYIIPGLGIAGLLAFAIEPISKWISSIGKATESQKAFNTAKQESASNIAKEVAETELLVGKINDNNTSQTERQRLLNDFIAKNPAVLSALNLQNIATLEGKGILDDYIETLKEKIRLQSLEQGYIKAVQKAADARSGALSEETDLKWYNKTARTIGDIALFKSQEETQEYIKKANAERREDAGKTADVVAENILKQIELEVKSTKKIKEVKDTSLKALESQLSATNERLRTAQEGADTKALQDEKKSLEAQIEQRNKILGLGKTKTTTPDKATPVGRSIEEAQSMYQRIEDIRNEYNRKLLSDDEAEIQTIIDKFQKVEDIITKFNEDPENKVKVDISELGEIKDKAIEDTRAKHEREAQEKINEERKRAQEVALNASKTHADKLADIEDEYYRNVADLGDKATMERLDNLDEQKEEALRAANDEAFLKTEIYKKSAEEALVLTRAQLKEQIKAIEELLSDGSIVGGIKDRLESELSSLKINLDLGAKSFNLDNLEAEKDNIQKAIDKYLQINKIGAFDTLSQSAIDANPELKKLIEHLQNVAGMIVFVKKNADDGGKGLSGFLARLTDNEGLKKFAEWGDMAAQSFGEMSNALGGAETKAGATLETMGELVGVAANLGKALLSGNPVQIVGAIAKGISSIFSISKRSKEMAAQARQSIADFYATAIKGEREYQDLLDQRAIDNVKNNSVRLQAIKDEIALRKIQADADNKEFNETMRKVSGKEYISGQKTEKYGGVLGIGKKTRVVDVMAPLRGKGFEELSSLLSQGKLEGEAKALVERLVELEKQGYDASLAMEALAKETAEIFTGTTADSLTDSLANMFKEGKTGAQDLADFFKSTMQDAAMSIFKNKVLAEMMSNFYESFADAAESGDELTASEIESLRAKWVADTEAANKKWDQMSQVTGMPMQNNDQSQGLSKGIAGITETTANRLEAEFGGLRLAQLSLLEITKEQVASIRQSENYAFQNLATALKTEQNTYRTANNTDQLSRLVNIETAIVSLNNKTPNSDALKRGAGY